jgi:glycosyltransferase involved in cell wall biosynthesis
MYQCRKKKKFVPDLIHCPFCTIGSLITARRFSGKYGNIPFTVSFRAKDLYSMYNPEPRIRRDLVAACSKVMTIAAVNRAEIKHLYPNIGHVPVVHSCIDPDYFSPTRHLRKKKGLIVSVGRLIEKKGFEYLIEACSLLKNEGHVFSCLIIGEGPLESDLRKLVISKKLENEITVTGPMLQSEVKNALDYAEMFVLPCITGGDKNRDILPNAIKEAMSMALPVITSNINGITEMIDDQINGFLVASKSSRELAEKISLLLVNHKKGRELGINARRKILDSFHMGKELAKLESIFHEVCNNSKNRHSRNKQEKNRFVL